METTLRGPLSLLMQTVNWTNVLQRKLFPHEEKNISTLSFSNERRGKRVYEDSKIKLEKNSESFSRIELSHVRETILKIQSFPHWVYWKVFLFSSCRKTEWTWTCDSCNSTFKIETNQRKKWNWKKVITVATVEHVQLNRQFLIVKSNKLNNEMGKVKLEFESLELPTVLSTWDREDTTTG